MKILFLDIDGVLNGHQYNDQAKSNGICKSCVSQLNRIILETDCKIVLSSAWRYMISGGAMTNTGFRYMMSTHGVVGLDIIDITVPDEEVPLRGNQISNWIQTNAYDSFAVVDDEWYGGPDYVRNRTTLTNGKIGLTEIDADKVIEILKGDTP